jgi:hypothetical protein
MGCFLGVAIAESADAAALRDAYGVFQQEALQLSNSKLQI